MSELYFNLKHDGGTYRVEIENQGDICVIRFGASFTLRLDEINLNKLRKHIHNTARDMCIERRDTSDISSAHDREVSSESEMVQAGIDAREALKAKRRSEQQVHDVWLPNDPVNW